VRAILDVDTGVDDALALALALRQPEIELEAVITVAGNVSLELTTRNTLKVLDWLGAGHVPVAMGADGPLHGAVCEASHWHGPDGLGGARLPEPSRQARHDGVGYLVERVTAEPGEITLVCTAPLTNLAHAIQRAPAFVQAVRQVVLMGGAARPPGNVTPSAEFNIYADPHAAALVFEQDWPLIMVGLDVTNQVVLTRAERQSLASRTTPEAALVYEVTRHLFEVRGVETMALHDPLAVGVAVQPDLVGSVARDVVVETRGEHTLGQTVVDLRPGAPPPSRRAQVCERVDAARFKALFSEVLGLAMG
jgi:inosine-uridine nucleoside N-ribohydrolase